jgi:hypothetical protein
MITNSSPILEECARPQRLQQRKLFIVDAPAPMLRRSTEFSKNARILYMTMRAMADGRTGQLRIGTRWLLATAIDSAAEMCRDNRMCAMRELIALGLVTAERERVSRIIKGRERVVLGRTKYTVHKPNTLLRSISSTVEEIDSQDVPKAPAVPSDCGCASSEDCVSDPRASSSSRSTGNRRTKADDDAIGRCLQTRKQQRKEEKVKDKAYLLRDLEPETRAWVRSRILSRAGRVVRNVHGFLRAAVPGFLEDFEIEVEEYLTLIAVDCIRTQLERRKNVRFEEVFPSLREEVQKHGLPHSQESFDLACKSAANALGLKDGDKPIARESW